MPDAGCRLVAVTFGAADPAGLARFWARALGWEPGDTDAAGVALSPTDGTRFVVRFEPVAEGQTARTRLHLDLTTSSAGDQQRTAEELVALGARHIDIGQTPEEGHLVLEDPEGNPFCIIEPENRWLADAPRLGAVNGDGHRATGAFWSEALGWPLIWDQDGETAVRDADGTGPILSWGGPPVSPKEGANRLRLDLAPRDPSRVDDELARLVAAGATELGRSPGRIDLADPDGNELGLLLPS